MDLLIPEVTIEECAEVIQAIIKVQRFGNTNSGYDNKRSLETEIGQLKYMLDALIHRWMLNEDNISWSYRLKSHSLIQYAAHNVCNQLEPKAE